MVSSVGRMGGGGCGKGSFPQWLTAFLQATYFIRCPLHADSHRNECKMFCVNCMGDPFCFYCSMIDHKEHTVVQVRKSSYHEVVRASEIQRFLDVTSIQTFIINKAKVVFLNERRQPKSGKKVVNACEICCKTLDFAFRFCSVNCKFNAIKGGDKNLSLIPRTKNEGTEDPNPKAAETDESSTPRKVQKMQHCNGGPTSGVLSTPSDDQKTNGRDPSSSSVDETNTENTTAATPTAIPFFDHSNSRKRKGTPRRATFF